MTYNQIILANPRIFLFVGFVMCFTDIVYTENYYDTYIDKDDAPKLKTIVPKVKYYLGK